MWVTHWLLQEMPSISQYPQQMTGDAFSEWHRLGEPSLWAAREHDSFAVNGCLTAHAKSRNMNWLVPGDAPGTWHELGRGALAARQTA